MKRAVIAALGASNILMGCTFPTMPWQEKPHSCHAGNLKPEAESAPSAVALKESPKPDEIKPPPGAYRPECKEIKNDCISCCSSHLPTCHGDAVPFNKCVAECMHSHGCDY